MRPIPSLSRKLVSASGFAIATAMLAHVSAQAQSFNGTAPLSALYTVTPSPGVTNIDIPGATAVINWTPSDTATGGAIDFQSVGTTATFTGTSGQSFAVLNRIIPIGSASNRPIQFNGTVNSEINFSGTSPGGSIFFYSPGGVILGSTANFDVGSLALTTLDLPYNATSGVFDNAGLYEFQQAQVADSKVRVLNGAQISTTVSGAYVALVAPSVTNDGTITVDGSVALVAADAANIRFRPNGLFDVEITNYTSSTATVIANGGTITGPVGSVNNAHRVYMVALASNDALTMAMGSGSSLGFAIAGAADVVGNSVVLSGGYDVVNGAPSTSPSVVNGTGQVSVTGGDAEITSNFFARANGSVNLGSSLAVGLNFASDVTVYSTGASSSLSANAGGSLTVVGNTSLYGDEVSGIDPAFGHDFSILASSGGLATFGGDVSLYSRAQGVSVFTTGGIGGVAGGGLTRIEASDGGQIVIQGNALLDSTGTGGAVSSFDGTGGVGNGGAATLRASGTTGSLLQIEGSATLYADGIGGSGSCPTCVQFGGVGTGGAVNILASGANTLSVGTATITRAKGIGGNAYGSGALAGSGIGGQGNVVAGLGGELILHGTIVTVDGTGGDGLAGASAGIGQGGLIEVSTSGAGISTATFNGALALAADGRAGQALSGGVAANALGGSVITSARDGSTINVTGDFSEVASGLAGNGQTGSSAGIGGTATLEAQDAGTVIVAGRTAFFTLGLGGILQQGGLPSLSVGGLSQISVLNGGTIDLGAETAVNAYAIGNRVSVNGLAGSAQGGTATITGTTGSIFSTDGFVDLNAIGQGSGTLGSPGSNIQGGDGVGGDASFAFTGGLATIGTNLTLTAYGFGGLGDEFNAAGVGGNGTGGVATLSVGTPSTLGNGGSVTVNGTVDIDVSGYGDDGFTGGAGFGGQAFVYARQGNLTLGDVTINALGEGSDGTSNGMGGTAIGGVVEVVALSAVEGPSQIITGQLFASTSSDAGDADNPGIPSTVGGNGAFAQGGSVLVAATAGNGVLQTGDVSIRAHAVGGFGGVGNNAPGGNGGDAAAGLVRIGLISGIDTGPINLGSATFGNVTARASGTGGDGGQGDSAVAGAVGGNGGNAIGGGAKLVVEGGLVTINGLGEWRADAIGGDGGSGDGFGNGGNAVIGSAIPGTPVGAGAIIKSRDGQPAQIGILDAGDLTFSATALGGVGAIAGTSSKAGRAVAFLTDGGSISADSISLLSQANFDASPNIVDPIKMTNSNATIAGAFSLTTSSATSVTLDQSLLTANSINITAGNWVLDPVVPASLGTLEANSFMSLSSGMNLVAHANLLTQNSLYLTALGAIDFGALDASGSIFASAGTTLSLDNVTSGDFLNLSAVSGISTGNLVAGTTIRAESDGNIITGNISAGGGVPRGPSSPSTAIGIFAGGNVSTGTIDTTSSLSVIAGNGIVAGQTTADDIVLLSGNNVSTGGLQASGRILIGNASMESLGFDGEDFAPNLLFAATLATPITPTPGAISISAPVSATAFTAATQAAFTSGAITVTPSATGSGNLRINAGGALTVSDLIVANSLVLQSNTSITGGNLIAQTNLATVTAPSITTGAIQGAAGVTVSGQTVATGALIASGGAVDASGLQTISTGSINANSSITVVGGSLAKIGNASATTGFVEVTSAGALETGNVNAGQTIDLTAVGTLLAGNLVAANALQLNTNGAITTGFLRSNAQGVKVASLGSSISTGNVNARNDVLLSAAQSLSVNGNINARDVLLLAGGNVGTGAVFAGVVSSAQSPTITNATGRVLIASNTMTTDSFLLSNSTDYAPLFAAVPVSLGGSVNIRGQVVAGRFVSYSQGNMSGAVIATFGSLEVESGGLVTVAQRWGSPDLEIVSSDIRIIDNGNLLSATGQPVLSGLRTTPTGSVSLSSIGNGPALIGDGLSGSGYALSAAELGLISASSIFIGAVDIATNPVDMLIGNLALTAGGDIGASNLAGTAGRIAFVTGNRTTQTPGGAIRVTGNITGTGFAATNVVEFTTGRFELDAATGSLSLTQTGTALGGTVEIAAANIHIASGTILDRLAADPFYAGHISDLNRPAAVQRPDGVLRALGLDLFPTGTLYIQNTGTTLDPAGFFADFELTDVTPPVDAKPASISVIVNGKWQTSAGIVSGVDARDLVVNNADTLEFYTSDSSINGCAINASACVAEPEVDPTPAISGQIAIISNNPLGNTPQFSDAPSASADPEDEQTPEEAIAEAASEAEDATSPIAPPPQIIDSKPLESKSMIEQPVAGSGNPSLIGSVVNEDSAEGIAQ